MHYVLDIVMVLIVAICIGIGMKRGCAKTLVRVVGTLLAIVLSFSLSGPLASGIFDGWLSGGIKTAIVENLPELNMGNLSIAVEEAFEGLPPFVTSFAETQKVDVEAITKDVLGKTEDNTEHLRETLATSLTENVVRPIAVSVLTILCFLLLLLVLIIAAHLLAKLVDTVFKLPLLGGLNKVFGAVLGVVHGALWIAVAATVVQLIMHFGGNEGVITPAVLEQTVITRQVMEINPLSSTIDDVIT